MTETYVARSYIGVVVERRVLPDARNYLVHPVTAVCSSMQQYAAVCSLSSSQPKAKKKSDGVLHDIHRDNEDSLCAVG